MNIDLINSNFRTDCSEENYKNKLIDKLKNDYGFTDDDVDFIMKYFPYWECGFHTLITVKIFPKKSVEEIFAYL